MKLLRVWLPFSIIQSQSPYTFYFATGETGLDKKKNPFVKGFHNWYQFHLEQTAGRLTYTQPIVDTSKTVMASCALTMISKDYFKLI